MGTKARNTQQDGERANFVALDYNVAKALLAASSDDSSRPALQYIHITPEYTEATNGHVLIRIPHAAGAVDGADMLIHRDVLKQVKKSPKYQRLYIQPETGRMWIGKGESIVDGTVEVLADLNPELYTDDDAAFPNTDQILNMANGRDPQKDRYVVLGTPILQALATFGQLREGAKASVRLRIPEHGRTIYDGQGFVDSAVRFTVGPADDAPTNAEGLAMPMRAY
jgi:hypothetical protein